MKIVVKEELKNILASRKSNSSIAPGFPKNSPDATGLRDLLYNGLQDIYRAEKQLAISLPKMIMQATSPELVMALSNHLVVTEEQVVRLEEVFASIGANVQAKKCAAMEELIKEGNEIIKSTLKGVVRDAGIIAASKKIEHYEIATYGTLCAFAKLLGESEAAELLLQTLNEEKEADDKLTEVTATFINTQVSGRDANKSGIETNG